MGLQTLLHAMEEYTKAKQELEAASFAPCSDWDCGLAVEFDASFAGEGPGQKLDRARAALEAALNEYIDARVKAILDNRSA